MLAFACVPFLSLVFFSSACFPENLDLTRPLHMLSCCFFLYFRVLLVVLLVTGSGVRQQRRRSKTSRRDRRLFAGVHDQV